MRQFYLPLRLGKRFKPPYKLEGQKLREQGIILDKFETYQATDPEVESSIASVVDDLYIEYKKQFPFGVVGYSFREFLEDALFTIKWRVETDIPEKLKRGIITKEDAERALYVLYKSFNKIKEYLQRQLFGGV